jgi:hypothetical protein
MSWTHALLARLDHWSDWLSPIVVKEVRQMVRGREFHYSFGASLIVALAIAFFGAAAATAAGGTTGAGTFSALMVCLTLLGMLNVPISTFSALRNERLEQTLDLVTVTALSPRRVVIGKLMAQAVKLVTLFAAFAPFMTMSFLLGGIDFVTILVSLGVLFLCSIWAASAFLFLSTVFKSRAMSGAVFGVGGIVLFVFVVGTFGRYVAGATFVAFSGGASGSGTWWGLAMLVSGCAVSTINCVLLAESRLRVASENRVTPLRIGFFVQFLVLVAWGLSFIGAAPTVRSNAAQVLAFVGGLHLALVAAFTVTEDFALPRLLLLQMQAKPAWDWLLTPLRPGGGRGAAYVLAQMPILVLAVSQLDASSSVIGWTLAMCAYIVFFSGVPSLVWRWLRPGRAAAFPLRVSVLVFLAVAVVVPDVLYYVVWQPDVFDGAFGRRHLLDPFRTLAYWHLVVSSEWLLAPTLIGMTGLTAYGGLMRLGALPGAAESEPEGVPAVD